MRLMLDNRKVKATARSMHQFCGNVRAIFPGEVANEIIETATIYLYVKVCREVFGRRFSDRSGKMMRDNLKYCTVSEVNRALARICREADGYEQGAAEMQPDMTTQEQFQVHVTGVVRAMLKEAGALDTGNEDAMLARAFKPFDAAVRAIKTHMLGIKRQNHFIMN